MTDPWLTGARISFFDERAAALLGEQPVEADGPATTVLFLSPQGRKENNPIQEGECGSEIFEVGPGDGPW
jgi:hypothetical protein